MGRKAPVKVDDIKNFAPDLTPEHPRERLCCGDGLYLLATLAGARLWQHRVRIPGFDGYVTLGDYGEKGKYKLNYTQARLRQAETRHRLANGEQPADIKFDLPAVREEARRQRRADGPTFGEIARAWMELDAPNVVDHVRQRRESRYEGYLKPVLGDRPIASITQDELLEAARRPLEQSLSGRDAKTVPRLLAQMIRQIFDYARLKNILPSSSFPDAHLVKLLPKEPPVQHRACIIDPQELGELLRKIQIWFSRCQLPQSGLALRLMPYVALRPGEVVGALWSEIDIKKALWTIPAERMKMRNPHIIPLSRQSIEILNETKRYTEKEKYIFYSARAKENGHISGNTIIKALNTLGYDTGKTMSPHGFRGTFSTILHESTLYNTLIIESQLSHTDNDTSRSAYNHARYLQDRREMMQLWADYLDALRDGSTLTLRDWAKSRSPKDGGERAE